MVSFVNTQGSVKIKLACSKALLLIISSSNIAIHSNGYIEGDKHSFFYKSRCSKCSPETKLFKSRVETQCRKIIFITPSNIKHFIERSSVTYYILEGYKMGNIRISSIWWLLFIFFIKWQHWCKFKIAKKNLQSKDLTIPLTANICLLLYNAQVNFSWLWTSVLWNLFCLKIFVSLFCTSGLLYFFRALDNHTS